MKSKVFFTYMVIAASVATMFFTASNERKQPGKDPLSPTDIEIYDSKSLLAIAERTANRVEFIDISSGSVISSVNTRFPPTGLGSSGNRIYVTGI